MYGGQIALSKMGAICLLAISKQMSSISMHIPRLVKIPWCLKLLSRNENKDISEVDNSQKLTKFAHEQSETRATQYQCSTKFGENPLIFTNHPEMKIRTCRGQITLSNFCLNLPINNPKPDLHIINAHTEFGENPLKFTQVIIWKQKYRQTIGVL